MKNNNTIYHYCSVETFMSIIENRSIRLSDLNKTNDYMEKKWANNLITEVLKEQLKKFGIALDLEKNYMYNEKSENHLQYYKNTLKDELYDQNLILISCFSNQEDKLSQWRAYGQDGTGVAIGFNYNKIKMLSGRNEYNGKKIVVTKVIYDETEQKKKLGKVIERGILRMKNYHKIDHFTDDFNVYLDEEFDGFCEVLMDDIRWVGCTIKNPAFSEEEEVRIIFDPSLSRISDDYGLYI